MGVDHEPCAPEPAAAARSRVASLPWAPTQLSADERERWLRAVLPLEPIRFIDGARARLLLQNRERDELVPAADGRRLKKAAPASALHEWYRERPPAAECGTPLGVRFLNGPLGLAPSRTARSQWLERRTALPPLESEGTLPRTPHSSRLTPFVLPIRVTHATGHYDVYVAPASAPSWRRGSRSLFPIGGVVLVTDATIRVRRLHRQAGRWPAIDAPVIEIPAGEIAKRLDEWARVSFLSLRDRPRLAAGGARRRTVGDLTGSCMCDLTSAGSPSRSPPLLAMGRLRSAARSGSTRRLEEPGGAFHLPALVSPICSCSPSPTPLLPRRGGEARRGGRRELFRLAQERAEVIGDRHPATVQNSCADPSRSRPRRRARRARDRERAILNAGHQAHALKPLLRIPVSGTAPSPAGLVSGGAARRRARRRRIARDGRDDLRPPRARLGFHFGRESRSRVRPSPS